MTDYQDLYNQIRKLGYTGGIVVKNGEQLGIEINCPALSLDTRVFILKVICGNEYTIIPFENSEIISITHNSPIHQIKEQ